MRAESVYLFGSHARGDAGPDSDLDIAVIVPNTAKSRYRRSVRARSLIGDIHFPKDIVVLTRSEWEAEPLRAPLRLQYSWKESGSMAKAKQRPVSAWLK
jgi:predicted nucleotidyltransferase